MSKIVSKHNHRNSTDISRLVCTEIGLTPVKGSSPGKSIRAMCSNRLGVGKYSLGMRESLVPPKSPNYWGPNMSATEMSGLRTAI